MKKTDQQQSAKSMIQSSTAQYLTFVSASGDDPNSIEVRYEDENAWMTQKMMAELYGVSTQMIGQYIKKLIANGEISDSVIKQYFITASDGKNYNTAQ